MAFRRSLIAIAVLLLVPSAFPWPACPPLAAKEPPAAVSTEPLKPQNDLPGLKNFAQVSDALSRGAQPTAEGFATLKARGIKTIVNLRSEHSDRSLLSGTGLQYVEIPCNPWHIKDEEIVEFLKVVRDPKNQPVFVHCAVGCDRTGTAVGAYRMMEQHWTTDDTIKELYRFGYHPIYPQIVSFLKAFDPAKIDGKIDAAPAPKVEVVK
jgi:protein tyrosine phosphatase (PTP) superfamily phosphohydrolase (DUF442 family)